MHFSSSIILCLVYIITVAAHCEHSEILAGYVPGVSGIPPIDKKSCLTNALLENPTLSDALECARTCRVGERPKTCYYKFVVERYNVNGHACDFCTSNFTNQVCPNCQCVIANGLDRAALIVNRMLPGPTIQVCLGDKIVVDVQNEIKDESLVIHWHGIFQRGTQYFDGAPFVTQCPISPSNTFRYQFRAGNSGTHFWHAHTGIQKMDGVTGTLVIREPAELEPNAHLYDFDLVNHVIHLSDWMNEESTERFPGRRTGVTGQFPDAVLINGKGQLSNINGTSSTGATEVITVDANQRYRFRSINSFCGVCPGQLTIEGHNLTLIATDGVAVKPIVVNSIVSLPAERFDFVINTNQAPGAYWIQLRALGECANNQIQTLAVLQYTNAPTKTATASPAYNDELNPGVVLNAVTNDCNNPAPNQVCISALKSAVPIHPATLKPKPDVQLYLPIGLTRYSPADLYRPNTYQHFLAPAPSVEVATTIDGISFVTPSSPLISQPKDLPPSQFCNSRNLPSNCNTTCLCTHLLKFPLNSVVEIILIDKFGVAEIEHPFHLHGYAFNIISMGQPLGPVTNDSSTLTVDLLKQLERDNQIKKNLKNPPFKDVIAVPNNGYVIFRFHATNPGYWLFHCHFIYHQMAGMVLIMQVGEQYDLPPVPENFPKCGNYLPPIHVV